MASIINDVHQFFYMHIPKNGGTSIGGHHSIPDIKGCLSDLEGNKVRPHVPASGFKCGDDKYAWENYHKFTFLRNPFDRAISLYNNFLNRIENDGQFPVNQDKFHKQTSKMSFLEFCKSIEKQIEEGNDLLRPQFWYFDNDINEFYNFDYIGSYRYLRSSLETVLDYLNVKTKYTLPHHRKAIDYHAKGRFYAYYKSQESLDIIKVIYADDFELYNNICGNR